MASYELINSITSLLKKIDILIEQQKKLQQRVIELENKNKELSRQHEEDVLRLERIQKDIEFLSVSYKLAESPEALVSARKKISRLIRTIDNCIRMIEED